jgi:hypothetical protein
MRWKKFGSDVDFVFRLFVPDEAATKTFFDSGRVVLINPSCPLNRIDQLVTTEPAGHETHLKHNRIPIEVHTPKDKILIQEVEQLVELGALLQVSNQKSFHEYIRRIADDLQDDARTFVLDINGIVFRIDLNLIASEITGISNCVDQKPTQSFSINWGFDILILFFVVIYAFRIVEAGVSRGSLHGVRETDRGLGVDVCKEPYGTETASRESLKPN